MKFFYTILVILCSTTIVLSQNVLETLQLNPNTKTEQRILKQFRKSSCYKDSMEYKIQTFYFLESTCHKDECQLCVMDSVLISENGFLNSLFLSKGSISVSRYAIYNDSLLLIATTYGSAYNYKAFCTFNSTQYLKILSYAMKNQYIIFHVFGLPYTFGYKNENVYVFKETYNNQDELIIDVIPFENYN